MESVFHKHQWDQDAKRSIALAEVRSRLVRAVGVVETLQLADLTAEGVMAGYFGLTLEKLAGRDYTHTQQVSARLHAMVDADGMPLFLSCGS
jgi:5-carboxymethyl-2-hydroxymuconate isomerase